MKNHLIVFLILGLASETYAGLERKEEKVNPERTDAVRQVWYRDGKRILAQQTVNDETGLSMCSFSTGKENKWALVLFFTKDRISSIGTSPVFGDNYRFHLSDFTADGIPDMIQVMQVDEDEMMTHHEAFSIVSGTVEPIPDELMKGRTQEFYYDEEIVTYLTKKLEQGD